VNNWEIAILKTYASKSGCAKNREIYEGVRAFITLTPEHQELTVHGGRPAYEHQVRSHIANLRQDGCLKKIERGRYCLTSKGKSRI
jgi:restriction endonuclease Mrr